MNEYLLSTNSFNKPKVLSGNDATYTLLVRLILLDPGTVIQSHPNMGVGLISRYRYSHTTDLEQLRSDISDQIGAYLPDLMATDITVSEGDDMDIIISITSDSVVYQISFNTTTLTLNEL